MIFSAFPMCQCLTHASASLSWTCFCVKLCRTSLLYPLMATMRERREVLQCQGLDCLAQCIRLSRLCPSYLCSHGEIVILDMVFWIIEWRRSRLQVCGRMLCPHEVFTSLSKMS
jgi:hypothetical protein